MTVCAEMEKTGIPPSACDVWSVSREPCNQSRPCPKLSSSYLVCHSIIRKQCHQLFGTAVTATLPWEWEYSYEDADNF